MNVKIKSEQSKTYFCEIKVGEVFKTGSDFMFMKVQECKNRRGATNNCVNLETGLFCFIPDVYKVDKVNGTFVEE